MQQRSRPGIVARLLAAGLVALAVPAALAAEENILMSGEATEQELIKALAPTRTIGRPPKVSLPITFETNSAQLTTAAMQQLGRVASALNDNAVGAASFDIEGHADPRGSHQLNLSLSQRRAESVRAYLVLQHAVAPQRLVALGKGDTEPLKPLDPAAPENRRVTFVRQPDLPIVDEKAR